MLAGGVTARIVIHADDAHFLRDLKSASALFVKCEALADKLPYHLGLRHARPRGEGPPAGFSFGIQPDHQGHLGLHQANTLSITPVSLLSAATLLAHKTVEPYPVDRRGGGP